SGSQLLAESCRIQIVVPEVHEDCVMRMRIRSPELLRREAYAVHVLRLSSEANRVGVREDEDTVVAIDHAAPAACVARDPRVTGSVHVPGADRVSHLEPGWHRVGEACSASALHVPSHAVGPQRARIECHGLGSGWAIASDAPDELGPHEEALAVEKLLESPE